MTIVLVLCAVVTLCAAVVALVLCRRSTAAEQRALTTLANAQKVLTEAEQIQHEVREAIGT